MAETILIHGRTTFRAEVSFKDSDGVPVYLSSKVLFFELAGGAFRKALVASTDNPLNAKISFTVAEVDQLPTRATAFIIRDETVPGGESRSITESCDPMTW